MFTIGELVKAVREERGLTQEALATKAGLSLSQIKKVETGVRGLTVESACKIFTNKR